MIHDYMQVYILKKEHLLNHQKLMQINVTNISLTNTQYFNRIDNHYNQINDSINQLIDDLGEKVQAELAYQEHSMLNDFKRQLISTKTSYDLLQKNRSQKAIMQNVLDDKTQHQKIFQLESDQAAKTTKIYQNLKRELKKSVQYERQLLLEINFLEKKCNLAIKKGQGLTEQLQEIQTFKRIENKKFTELIQNIETKNQQKFSMNTTKNKWNENLENRLKNRIQELKQFVEQYVEEPNNLEKYILKHDIENYKSDRQKLILIEQMIDDRHFRKYLFQVLFKNGAKESVKQICQ